MESLSQITTNEQNQKKLGKIGESGELCLKSKYMPGTVIKQFREFRNYSQDYVARKMGISQNAYSKIENNITQLTVTHVKQLSTILDVPVVDLLRDEFEIRKPHHLSTDHVTRKELLLYLHDFQHTIKLKREEDHKLYSAVMAILQTAYYVAEDIQ